MRINPRMIEWFVICGLGLVTVIAFLMLSGGMINTVTETTITNMLLLMVFGALLLIAIIQLRVFDKLHKKGGL